ncbi:Ino eighty subunit 2 [Pseudocercospora fuligena]|uniref:Ino eighty subunit 2 n=1 Tax=Pseudocercospora fuligena TaxID=685502 RepID=A0A8H6RPG7_9PEZI|nr:Ino eighty subunit 2 [Pseudocercospora fuligena]
MPPERRSARSVSNTSAKVTAQPYTRANTRSSPGTSRPGASISRPANGKTLLRLTVKAPPSKLRQATSGSAIPPNPYADTPSESDATPAPRAARATRNPRTVVDPDSDDLDDEMEDAEGEDDEDAEGELDNDIRDNEDGEDDADGEADDDEDEMQVDHPPPPVITQSRAPGKAKPNVTVTAPPEGPLKSVEDKEMDDDDDDDELSELDSNEDAEGEEEEEEEEEGEEDDSDEDDENSRSATPDLSKLTKRQRGGLDDFGGELMSLSNEAQKKKQLTEEENAMRRAEMARRRKNLSEKRNEEEKMDTINKLLSKPAPKRRTRAEMEAARAAEETPNPEGHNPNGPDPTYLRWVNRREGSHVVVTQQWQESPLGDMFTKQVNSSRLIEEVS